MALRTIEPGSRFGRLVVIREVEPEMRSYPGNPRHKTRRFACRCDCGTETVVAMSHLGRDTASCGCGNRAALLKVNLKHGEAKQGRQSAEYRAWAKMIARCEDPKNNRYALYGGRGIRVCERWRSDYAAFLADVGRRPSPGHSIDRYPDNDGNYEPGNVRWATALEQRHNQRRAQASTCAA